MVGTSKNCKNQSRGHTLAVSFYGESNKITKPRKSNNIIAKLIKSTKTAMHHQIMSLNCLQAAQLRACDKTFIDHRMNFYIHLKNTGRMLINTRNQTQKRRFTRTIMSNKRYALTLINSAIDIFKSSNHGSTTAPAEATTGN